MLQSLHQSAEKMGNSHHQDVVQVSRWEFLIARAKLLEILEVIEVDDEASVETHADVDRRGSSHKL